MKLEEAIELQDELLSLLPEVGFNKYIASTQLGIEALKRYQNLRSRHRIPYWERLPGETED